MKVLLINNLGGGFASHIEIPDRMTVRELVQREIGGSKVPARAILE